MTTDIATTQAPSSVQLIDFDDAQIVPGIVNDTYFLIVSGMKPYQNMKVTLLPRTYIRQPEYWEVEVAGAVYGIPLPVMTPYHEFLPLEGSRGTKGILVIGKSTTCKLEFPVAN
ncbi:hypothetical protein [Virgisporangium aurantiacum]|uniref:Uncharacterized protein n=1 Tax=Virgisporangium aurantiacum TaxID=175570 RepID=A0A8J3ZL13_9ACTN|nr:hypothetical protein [Virgisporangium aurantiacum]GIJ64897.1 hypothetical protein Vau01_124130 [Virgisporangium aurantiacum]